MNNLFRKIKYPKLLLLILAFIFAYLIFTLNNFDFLKNIIISSGYVGAFTSGIFFSYGFTAGLSVGSFLILSKTQNIILTGILGGAGALIGDLLIFKFIRTSFKDEIKKISEEKLIKKISETISQKVKTVILYILSCIIIASPLPDEIGIFLLASSTKISNKIFSVLSFLLNTTGIFAILIIGHYI